MIKQLLRSAVVKNASWLIFGRVVQMVISLVVGVLTARYLGPSNYGLINYAAAYASFFMVFCTLGINSVLVKEFVDHPEEEGTIIGSTLLLQAISSLLSVGLILSLVCVLDAGEKTTIAVTALYSMSLLFRIFETINYWFQSKLRSKVTAMILLTAYLVTSAYKVVLLVLHKSVEWFAVATALDCLCVGLLLLVFYYKHGGSKIRCSLTVAKRLLRKSVHFILPGMMVAVYGYVDKFMLKHMLSESDVGYYAIATAICGMWTFVLSAVIDSLFPPIMESHKTDRQRYEKKNRQLYAVVFYIAMAVSLLICLFGRLIVQILYGQAYLPSVLPLKVVTWYTAFSYRGVARNAWVVCEDKQRYLKYIYVAAALVNVLLNLLFIPLLGAAGAAIASLVTQITTTLVVPLLIKELRPNSMLMLEGILLRKIR